ncbi:MAG: exosortase/archaeosortase family protein [Planctomycetes bacterium]|nr:exosortase/archaeosortase family protein [Planctomycetota bacterium]
MSSISFAPTDAPAPATTASRGAAWQLTALVAVLGWAYLPMLRVFADKWLNDPQYSHGLLVPFFSAYLLWRYSRTGSRTPADVPTGGFGWAALARGFRAVVRDVGRADDRPMPVLGCGLLVAALGLRAASGALLFYQFDAASFLLSLVAVSLVLGGVPLLKRTAPAIAFLIFMVPLPYELERNVGAPLKTAATVSSTFLLQTLGLPAIRDGNLILIDEVRLGVVDACSGLKMMVTFAAFSVGAVLLMRRSRFEKLMVLLGIVPIAVLTNVLRITATGISFSGISDRATQDFLHDMHGWLMMPVGLALLALEVWVLKRLVVEDEPA